MVSKSQDVQNLAIDYSTSCIGGLAATATAMAMAAAAAAAAAGAAGAAGVPASLSCGSRRIHCVVAAEPKAASSAPVASTAAFGSRVVGLPPTSTGVSLGGKVGARRSTCSRGLTELDDCRTPTGGKADCSVTAGGSFGSVRLWCSVCPKI